MNAVFGNLMRELMGAGTGPVPASTQEQFHQAAQSAPPELLGQGIAAAFDSEQTPEFGEMVAHMFGNANPGQKSGIVNRLLAGLGPAATSILSRLGIAAAPQAGQPVPSVTTEQATRMSPAQVEELATHAKNANPGIVQSMSQFYAQHPVLVKTLGAAALAIISNRIMNRPH